MGRNGYEQSQNTEWLREGGGGNKRTAAPSEVKNRFSRWKLEKKGHKRGRELQHELQHGMHVIWDVETSSRPVLFMRIWWGVVVVVVVVVVGGGVLPSICEARPTKSVM